MDVSLVPALLLQGDIGDAVGGLAVLGFGMTMMFVSIAVALVFIVGMWKVYTKAGKPGWACLIPIYNVVVLLEIVGRPVWWVLLMFIPLVNIAFLLIMYFELAKSFGQGALFVLLMLMGGIGFIVLGFGGYRYLGPAAASGSLSTGPTPA